MKSQLTYSPTSYSFSLVDLQPCGSLSRLRYSDSNPRGQSRACFGNKVYPNTAHTHHLHIVCGCFHAPMAETIWSAKPATFTIWPFIQRFPHPDNMFFSLATLWPPANPDAPVRICSFLRPERLGGAGCLSPLSVPLVMAEVTPSIIKLQCFPSC